MYSMMSVIFLNLILMGIEASRVMFLSKALSGLFGVLKAIKVRSRHVIYMFSSD